MKNLFFCSAIVLTFLLVGCSHNSVCYSDGIGVETTANPETFTFGLNFRYGKIFSAVVRENVQVEMIGKGSTTGGKNGATNDSNVSTSASTNASNVSTSASAQGNVKIKIGKQISGYFVDCLKHGAKVEEIKNYMKNE